MGLSIVGGIDQCSHPFGSPSCPGVFISKITGNSPAASSQRLRVGDRIIAVNNVDISHAKHDDAVQVFSLLLTPILCFCIRYSVQALKTSGNLNAGAEKQNVPIRLRVCHELQPKALRELIFVRQFEGQPLGLSICGGINNSVNSMDPTDEGIFIETIEEGSVVAQQQLNLDPKQRLSVGVRLLEVSFSVDYCLRFC